VKLVNNALFAANIQLVAQAEQVANDLGLATTSLLPYPTDGTAPADIGLGQVLVVLGSAPGMLATSGTATSTPTTVA
jgi:hypothetical protein